jgi:hypothetical protein
MSEMKVQEAKNGAAQLSQGKYFLMVNKFRIKKGANTGQGLIVVRLNHLESKRDDPDTGIFVEDKSFLLSQKQFDIWIALLMQVSNKKLTEIKDGEKDASQTSL